MNDYEHLTIHKARERELIDRAERMRLSRSRRRLPGGVVESLDSLINVSRSLIARGLRKLADSIDAYRAGCVDGTVTCE